MAWEMQSSRCQNWRDHPTSPTILTCVLEVNSRTATSALPVIPAVRPAGKEDPLNASRVISAKDFTMARAIITSAPVAHTKLMA